MNEKQKKYFRSILESQLEGLLHLSHAALSEMTSRNGREIEHLDFASDDIEQTMKIRIRSREGQLMKKIHAALERLDGGTYGICDTCGEDISIRRLEARPVTTKCLACKTEEERYELMVH